MRFKNFNDNWSKYTILDLGSMNRGISKHRPRDDEKLYGGDYPFIQTGNVKNSNLFITNFDKTYSDIGLKQSKLWKKGTLCITIAANIADTALLGIDACFPDSIIGWNSNNLTSNLFIKYYFDFYKNSLMKLSVGGAQDNLNLDKLKKLKLNIPSLPEQEKITAFLQKIDERIETQIKIIDDLKKIKKIINNQLYDNLNCQYTRFKNIYSIAKEGGTPPTANSEYYNGNIPFIKVDDLNSKYIEKNKTYISTLGMENSSAWLIPENSIIMSNGATIGNASINTYPVTTKQGILGIVPQKNILTEFLYYTLSSLQFKKQIKSITTKGTIDCAYIKDIDQIKVKIPNIEKQTHIVNTLSCIDEKIEIESLILDQLTHLKHYLLKNMFI